MIENIYNTISAIKPFDELEESHIQDILAWINSGAPIFRIKKPDIPSKHLVSYFVLFDESASKILLVDHKKAGLWLPTGGHVEINEYPREAVQRECLEELGILADFRMDEPLFITSTMTKGLARHTDVSLWYVLRGNHQHQYKFDSGEFNRIKWFAFDEIPYGRTDPCMERFINKFGKILREL
jgi:8-oxo-dGTP diphosphatase